MTIPIILRPEVMAYETNINCSITVSRRRAYSKTVHHKHSCWLKLTTIL